MAFKNEPTNVHNNMPPVALDDSNFADPYALATLMAGKAGIPSDVLDRVHTDIDELTKNSFLGLLDRFQMNLGVTTDYVQLTESSTPDYVIDDDGAVTRAGDVFTIDWTAVEGYEAGTDQFFFEVNTTFIAWDDTGKQEHGVITAIDKAANTFTAKPREGADWTVATSNLTIQPIGSDYDKGSCSPEGRLEVRKTKSVIQKLQTVKTAIKTVGGKKIKLCLDKDTVKWYPDNWVRTRKQLNKDVATTLLLEVPSADGSGAHGIGKFGSLGLFENMRQNSLVNDGYITDVAGLQAVTSYWDSLGYGERNFNALVDVQQFRYLETIAHTYATSMGLELSLVLNNNLDNFMKFGFSSLTIDGYTIRFTKWDLTTGNSPFGKKRIVMPKGIIFPEGMVETEIFGVKRKVPYIFKVYQDMDAKRGVVREYSTGGFAGGNGSDCEYLKKSWSTTVAIVAVVPEALVLID